MNHDDYVHRIGRTAINVKDGEALSFVTPEEITNWNRLAKKYSLNSIMLHEDKSQKAKLRAKFQKRFSQAKKNDSKNVSSKKNNSNKIKRKSPTKKKSASTTNRKKY
jgi:superfamily II DNA/RNA helicase